jgi:hypothetical protein
MATLLYRNSITREQLQRCLSVPLRLPIGALAERDHHQPSTQAARLGLHAESGSVMYNGTEWR